MFNSQSTKQIIADIDFEVNSESRLSHSVSENAQTSHRAFRALRAQSHEKVRKESFRGARPRVLNSVCGEDDSNQEANKAQCLQIPETISAAEREAHSLTHVPSGHGTQLVREPKVNSAITNQSRRL